jgi:hypothetical protein
MMAQVWGSSVADAAAAMGVSATALANGLTMSSTVGQWRQIVTNKIGRYGEPSCLAIGERYVQSCM